MSVTNEQRQKLEEEVVVNENKTTELVEVEVESKKAKRVATAKKVLKVAGIATAGAIVGFLLGSKSGRKDEDCDDYEDVDAEYDVSDEE